jgi:hypothetical protein
MKPYPYFLLLPLGAVGFSAQSGHSIVKLADFAIGQPRRFGASHHHFRFAEGGVISFSLASDLLPDSV